MNAVCYCFRSFSVIYKIRVLIIIIFTNIKWPYQILLERLCLCSS